MIAHYGYADAEGEFYITVDTGGCDGCPGRPCLGSCPEGLFVLEENPYGELEVTVDDSKRKRLKYLCAGCKTEAAGTPPPCVAACPRCALRHSW